MCTKYTIINFKNVIDTYQSAIPKNQKIKLIQKNWLPLYTHSKLSSEFAYLTGKIMGDGHLSNVFCVYFIGNESEMISIKNLLVNQFKINSKHTSITRRKTKGISHCLRINNCLFGRIMYCLGNPKGNKTKQKFLIPDWIYKKKIFKKRFLQAILEDELTTIKIYQASHAITPRFKLAKSKVFITNLSQLMLQVKNMIESFGITCSEISKPTKLKNTKSLEIYFNINRNKYNIIKFSEKIGFRFNYNKEKKLQDCIQILKKTRHNRKPNINKQKILELHTKGLSIRQISKIVNLNRTSVHRIIKKRNKIPFSISPRNLII